MHFYAAMGEPLVFVTGSDSMEMVELISPNKFLALE
jgi:hypothetical protein